MSDTRVGLIVDIIGDKEALSNLRTLRKAAEELNRKKINLALDSSEIQKKINLVQRHLNDLTKKKTDIKIEGGDLKKVEKQIATTKKVLADLKNERADIRVDASEVKLASGYLKEMQKNAVSVRDVLSGLGGAMSTVGSSLQNLGNAFGGNILSTIKTTLTAYGTLTATQGLKSAIGRYDTMTTFPKLMQQVGYTSEQAEGAVEKLNDAVLGLPTGLNEIVDNAKQYILAMNDIDKGTQLAIAANNAFLANASDASQTAYGMRQIMDILSKGSLRSMEWQSLLTSLGTSVQPIAEKMGYSADEIGKFRSELQDGTIDAMAFIDALIEVGTGTGELVSRVDIQKDTLNATLTNIKNAFSIIGYGVLDELNTLFEEYTGKSLPENIKGISDWLKSNLKPALQGWIQDNGDRIMGFWERLKGFDWGKLLSSIGGAIDNLVSAFAKLVDVVPEDLLTGFITFSTVYASPVGKGLSMIGGALKMISGISLHKVNGELNTMGKLLGKFSSFAGGGVMGGLGAFAAILAGTSAYEHYKTDKRYEDAYGRVAGGDAMPTTAEQALRDLQRAQTRYGELKSQYDALEMYKTYDADGQEVMLHRNEEEARKLGIAMREQQMVIDGLKGSYEALSSAEKVSADGMDVMAEALEETSDVATKVKERFDELREGIQQTIQGQISSFEELKQASNMSSVEMANNTEKNANEVQDWLSNLETAYAFQQKIWEEGGYTDASGNTLTPEMFSRALAEATEGGFEGRGILQGLIEGIDGYSTEDALNYLYEMASNLQEADFGGMMAADLIASFQETVESGQFVDAFGNIGTQAGTAMKENFEAALTGGGMEATSKYQELYGNTETAQTFLGTLTESAGTATEAMGGASEAASTASETVSGYGESAGEAAAQNDALATASTAAATAVSMAGTVAAGASGMFGGLAGAVGSVATQAFAAISALSTLAATIAAMPTQKDIYINVHRNGSVGNVPVGGEPMSTGGMVYAADGKFIRFIPRGSDTVPAMLTPGEFVVKQRATKKYLPVLERINNLDLTGAFNSLWSMMPLPMVGGTTNNTYNRDNHATVNNYFNGESQDYSQRKAYRWAWQL